MKKYIFLFIVGIALISVITIVFITKNTSTASAANPDFLRIHIRANSNNEDDQNVKYKVKEKIVEYLSPLIINCKTQKEALSVAKENLSKICKIANNTLKENGFFYTCKAELRTENFPTRSYGNLTLENGCYEALILELGSGSGDNWWCVMFPPLCFVGSEEQGSVHYESKIWNNLKKYL